jgi:putative chitinase
MFVTAARIALLAPQIYVATAEAIAPLIDQEMPKWGVNTLLRRAHFMAQACWESAHFSRMQENLNYKSPARIAAVWPRLAGRAADLADKPLQLANAAYANRNGNGNEASGDGWRYHGRGFLQITGRANYAAAGKGLGLDLINDPDLLASAVGAVKSALWFWKAHGCNDAADMDDCEAITSIINGPARDGLTQRRELAELAKPIFA